MASSSYEERGLDSATSDAVWRYEEMERLSSKVQKTTVSVCYDGVLAMMDLIALVPTAKVIELIFTLAFGCLRLGL